MRDDKRKHDSDATVPEDDFWASILNETMAEAEERLGEPKPSDDDMSYSNILQVLLQKCV